MNPKPETLNLLSKEVKINCFLLLAAMVFILSITSCQKDDICSEATPTTPLLVITFYDSDNPSEPKDVEGFNLIAEGVSDSLYASPQTTDSIAIPLKTFQAFTRYKFIVNLGEEEENPIPTNVDEVEFGYFPNEVYVNKACGFKTEYLDLQAVVEQENAGKNWIEDIVVERTTVKDETSAHIIILH